MVQPGIAALSRIGELLKLKTEEEVSGDKKTGRIEDIVCSDVSFAYTEKPVIRNFNMRAHKNTKIVLSGKNGSGKTTVAKLLLGFYKNYSGSLLDNIRYISPDLKEQEVMAALKKAGLTISEFENGLHSMVNENGKNLSGGQRQKIALARMIVKNPDVMIFDEATSNLDVAASNLLKQSVHSIFADKICIIITHVVLCQEKVQIKCNQFSLFWAKFNLLFLLHSPRCFQDIAPHIHLETNIHNDCECARYCKMFRCIQKSIYVHVHN